MARCAEDIIMYDYLAKENVPVIGCLHAQFDSLWQQQEEAKRDGCAQIVRLLERVKGLEKNSWDREDAVEDMG